MRIGKLVFDEKQRAKTNSLILGTIGYGKSRFLEFEQRQNIQKQIPFCSIDYHGAMYRNLISWFAANGYYRNINLLDLSQGSFVTGVDFFRRIEGVDTGVQVSGMVDAVMSAWGDKNSNTYPVIFRILTILFTVMIERGIPLPDTLSLLTNRNALTAQVNQLSNSLIRTVWTDLEKLPPSEWGRYVAPTVNRLFRLVQSKSIQRFMSLGKAEGTREFEGHTFVNLASSDQLDADAARTFGALYLNHLYMSSKRRRGKFGNDPSPYYCYVDEWWLVASPDYGRILAECRKFGLLLTLANQDLSQIKDTFGDSFKESILTLCQRQVCFGGLNDNDAGRLAREWGIQPQVIKNLQDRECLIKLPRQPVALIQVPQVDEPYLLDEKIKRYEQKIAERTGALPVAEVDRLLNRPQNEEDLDPNE